MQKEPLNYVDDKTNVLPISSLPEPLMAPPPPPVNSIEIRSRNMKPEPIYEALTHSNEIKHTTDIKNGIKIIPSSTPIENEREQRRKFRVEKKLQEMHQNEIQNEVYNNGSRYNILNFAEHFFNVHERFVDGTLISTITRKGKKAMDVVPKHEMITFTRSEKIATSHIHMYDPENISLSCNIFRVSIFTNKGIAFVRNHVIIMLD